MTGQSHWTRCAIVSALSLALIATAAGAEQAADKGEGNPHVWKPRVKSVTAFKNGLGFFMSEGDVKLRDGWCQSTEIPPAAFGTLAIYAHDEGQAVDIVGAGPGQVVQFDGVDAPADVEAKRDRLGAYAELNVQLTYEQDGRERTAAGKLADVAGRYAILEGESGNFAVPIEAITRLQLLGLPIRVHVTGDDKTPNRTTLGMAYLRKGVTWIPEYTLRIIDEETAELTLRGTFVNEAEDLVGCDINFVVGSPHFVHTEYMAPIAVGQTIRTIGAAVAPQRLSNQITNSGVLTSTGVINGRVVQQRVESRGGDVRGALGNLPQMTGPAATDYTVYTKKHLTVRRGEKAIVTLFRKTIRYSHVYRWTPPSAMQHLLVLHNETDTAWTTGPCLALTAGQPLGEDLLKYTPRQGTAELPVTAAINIAHRKTEAEVERKLKAHSPSHNVYLDLVTLKGELELRNFEKKPVRLAITVAVPGKPTEATDDGVTAADPDRLRLTERAGTVTWELTLEPAQTRTLTYVYERYVPSQ